MAVHNVMGATNFGTVVIDFHKEFIDYMEQVSFDETLGTVEDSIKSFCGNDFKKCIRKAIVNDHVATGSWFTVNVIRAINTLIDCGLIFYWAALKWRQNIVIEIPLVASWPVLMIRGKKELSDLVKTTACLPVPVAIRQQNEDIQFFFINFPDELLDIEPVLKRKISQVTQLSTKPFHLFEDPAEVSESSPSHQEIDRALAWGTLQQWSLDMPHLQYCLEKGPIPFSERKACYFLTEDLYLIRFLIKPDNYSVVRVFSWTDSNDPFGSSLIRYLWNCVNLLRDSVAIDMPVVTAPDSNIQPEPEPVRNELERCFASVNSPGCPYDVRKDPHWKVKCFENAVAIANNTDGLDTFLSEVYLCLLKNFTTQTAQDIMKELVLKSIDSATTPFGENASAVPSKETTSSGNEEQESMVVIESNVPLDQLVSYFSEGNGVDKTLELNPLHQETVTNSPSTPSASNIDIQRGSLSNSTVRAPAKSPVLKPAKSAGTMITLSKSLLDISRDERRPSTVTSNHGQFHSQSKCDRGDVSTNDSSANVVVNYSNGHAKRNIISRHQDIHITNSGSAVVRNAQTNLYQAIPKVFKKKRLSRVNVVTSKQDPPIVVSSKETNPPIKPTTSVMVVSSPKYNIRRKSGPQEVTPNQLKQLSPAEPIVAPPSRLDYSPQTLSTETENIRRKTGAQVTSNQPNHLLPAGSVVVSSNQLNYPRQPASVSLPQTLSTETENIRRKTGAQVTSNQPNHLLPAGSVVVSSNQLAYPRQPAFVSVPPTFSTDAENSSLSRVSTLEPNVAKTTKITNSDVSSTRSRRTFVTEIKRQTVVTTDTQVKRVCLEGDAKMTMEHSQTTRSTTDFKRTTKTIQKQPVVYVDIINTSNVNSKDSKMKRNVSKVEGLQSIHTGQSIFHRGNIWVKDRGSNDVQKAVNTDADIGKEHDVSLEDHAGNLTPANGVIDGIPADFLEEEHVQMNTGKESDKCNQAKFTRNVGYDKKFAEDCLQQESELNDSDPKAPKMAKNKKALTEKRKRKATNQAKQVHQSINDHLMDDDKLPGEDGKANLKPAKNLEQMSDFLNDGEGPTGVVEEQAGDFITKGEINMSKATLNIPSEWCLPTTNVKDEIDEVDQTSSENTVFEETTSVDNTLLINQDMTKTGYVAEENITVTSNSASEDEIMEVVEVKIKRKIWKQTRNVNMVDKACQTDVLVVDIDED